MFIGKLARKTLRVGPMALSPFWGNGQWTVTVLLAQYLYLIAEQIHNQHCGQTITIEILW